VDETIGYGPEQRCTVLFVRGGRRMVIVRDELEPLTEAEQAAYEMVRMALLELERERTPEVALADRWKGGEMVLKPKDPSLAAKTIPLAVFFRKIVMLRDRIRYLEQKINAHKGLDDTDKVELQQYLTQMQGSLTTFNVLFREREDWFTGQKGSRDQD
jgi:hypothetical protein